MTRTQRNVLVITSLLVALTGVAITLIILGRAHHAAVPTSISPRVMPPQTSVALMPASTSNATAPQTLRAEELAGEFLDLESARQALIALMQDSDEPMLRERWLLLEMSPEADLPQDKGFVKRFGGCSIDLSNKSWTANFDSGPRSAIFFYFGTFSKDEAGRWEAQLTRRSLGIRD
jgi:hypothetical protein